VIKEKENDLRFQNKFSYYGVQHKSKINNNNDYLNKPNGLDKEKDIYTILSNTRTPQNKTKLNYYDNSTKTKTNETTDKETITTQTQRKSMNRTAAERFKI
jgi:hypothetical protein